MVSEARNMVLEGCSLEIGYVFRKRVKTVAKNINFQIGSGDLVAIVGANGSGKSTLLRTLAGVQRPLGGNIKVNGKEVKNHSPLELARKLSLVLTEQLPSRNLRVNELVVLGRQPYTNWLGTLTHKDITVVEEVIEQLNLGSYVQTPCYELSDGQLQRVMIARALAQDTLLVLLDEPTTHLDIYHKAYILKLLRKVAHETQRTMVFSTHEIDLAIQLCDHMLVMGSEEVVFGTPEQLIGKGSFNQLFPEDLVHFDVTTKTFKLD